jgi:sigma-E factor negative regulatory protein RseB
VVTKFRNVKIFKVAVIMTAIFVSSYSISQQEKSAQMLMRNMIEASGALNYSGLITYEKSGRLKTSKIIHLVQDGINFEKIIHLDGAEGEFSRFRSDTSCEPGHLKTLNIDSRPNISTDSFDLIQKFYSLEIRGQLRVANRKASLLLVSPKDKHRLPYVLAIDNETNLLLMSVILDLSGNPLERFQFIELSVDEDLLSLDFPKVPLKAEKDCKSDDSSIDGVNWSASWVPPGFQLVNFEKNKETGQQLLVYSDGIAVFTVFVESPQVSVSLPVLATRHGASALVTSKIKSFDKEVIVSVVGEVPAGTAKMVSESIVHASKLSKPS